MISGCDNSDQRMVEVDYSNGFSASLHNHFSFRRYVFLRTCIIENLEILVILYQVMNMKPPFFFTMKIENSLLLLQRLPAVAKSQLKKPPSFFSM